MKEFTKGLWNDHPALRQLLGMCSTLAVTTSVINGVSMGLAVIFVLFFSALFVSLVKNFVPNEVRIAIYILIVATFVTIVDIFFRANFPQVSKALGPYVPLIIVNCIILGRCEAFASKNNIRTSLVDAIGMGLGYTWALFILGAIREILGSGTIAGIRMFPAGYNPLIVMVLPPGAFLVLGLLVAVMNRIENK